MVGKPDDWVPRGTVLVLAVETTTSLAAWTYDFLAAGPILAASLETGDTSSGGGPGELRGELVGGSGGNRVPCGLAGGGG